MRKVVAAILISVLAAAVPAFTWAQEQGGMDYDEMMGGMGGGMMMGQGTGMMGMGGGMMGTGPVWMLDLSGEQRTKINRIQDELRKEHWTIMGKIMDEQAKLRDLYEADTPDAKKIGAVYDTIFSLRKQMIMTRIEATNKVRGVLTVEQVEQLRKLRRGRWGMMGGCMMGGMGGGPTHGMMGK